MGCDGLQHLALAPAPIEFAPSLISCEGLADDGQNLGALRACQAGVVHAAAPARLA